ncbi:MAG: hypothetical protein QXE51_03280 [Nitrososphaeria archaeon]
MSEPQPPPEPQPPTPTETQPQPQPDIKEIIKSVDTSKEPTKVLKVKKILTTLQEKGYWRLGEKLPQGIQEYIGNIVGSETGDLVRYVIKRMGKEAVKKPPVKAEELKLEIEGAPKEIKEEKEEAKPTELPTTTISLTENDIKAILQTINDTAKNTLGYTPYPPELINLLATLDAKIFSSIQIETKTVYVNYTTIFAIALIIHLLPLLPLILNIILKKPMKEEPKNE